MSISRMLIQSVSTKSVKTSWLKLESPPQKLWRDFFAYRELLSDQKDIPCPPAYLSISFVFHLGTIPELIAMLVRSSRSFVVQLECPKIKRQQGV